MAVSIAPTVLISDFIGKLKGPSSHEVNQKLGAGRKLLEWQSGHGVVGFGKKDLEWARACIQNQREHHACGTMFDRLTKGTPPRGSRRAG